MKYVYFLVAFNLLFSCSPKLSTTIPPELNPIITDFQSSDDYIILQKKYPQFDISKVIILDTGKVEGLMVNIVKLEENGVIGITNDEGGCGFVKLDKIVPNAFIRTGYITLSDTTSSGEKLADKILLEYKAGKPFEDLGRIYGTSGNYGQIGHYRESELMPEFTTAIKEHKLETAHKAFIKEIGWCLIKTQEITSFKEYHLIEVTKENCE